MEIMFNLKSFRKDTCNKFFIIFKFKNLNIIYNNDKHYN